MESDISPSCVDPSGIYLTVGVSFYGGPNGFWHIDPTVRKRQIYIFRCAERVAITTLYTFL